MPLVAENPSLSLISFFLKISVTSCCKLFLKENFKLKTIISHRIFTANIFFLVFNFFGYLKADFHCKFVTGLDHHKRSAHNVNIHRVERESCPLYEYI